MLLKLVSGVLGHIKIASNKPQTSATPDLCMEPQSLNIQLMCVKIAIKRSPVKVLKTSYVQSENLQ